MIRKVDVTDDARIVEYLKAFHNDKSDLARALRIPDSFQLLHYRKLISTSNLLMFRIFFAIHNIPITKAMRTINPIEVS